MRQKIIAVDFDGTITTDSPYPITGELRPEAKKYLLSLYEKGYKLVLWTARNRKKQDYQAAIDLINDWGLPLVLPEDVPGKIVADFYIDDRSYPGKLNWKKIYNYIIKNI